MLTAKIRFIGIARLVTNPGWAIQRHSHLFHEMIILYKGRLYVRIASQSYTAEKGDILFYPEGVAHEEKIDPKDPMESIYIGWEGSPGEGDFLVHDVDGRVRMLAEWLLEEETRNPGESNVIRQPYLAAILAEFARIGGPQNKNELLRSVRVFMRDNIARSLGLEDLADHAGMSKFHFLRMYKKLCGNTPMQDLHFMRARAARDMIITTNKPLKTIAQDAGLGDASHLSRVFRQYFNATPGYFRRGAESES
jgi:AraC-like DNA-binding protein